MSVETHAHFVQRLKLLGRKHEMMTNGYITKVGRDGLITIKPKRARRGFPFKGLILTVLAFFAFKAFMLVANGEVSYQDRLATLEQGTFIEAGGAKLMGIDPLTQLMADQMIAFMR